MSQKSDSRGKDEPDTPSLFTRLMEGAIAFAVCCFLIRQGICWLISVEIPLSIIAVIAGVIYISYRVYKWRKQHDGY